MNKNKLMAEKIAQLVKEIGGCVYYVGGYVRDIFRNIENKDIDIEVHGIEPDALKNILDSLGTRIEIGESFGIFALKGYDIDIAMPRKEHLTGKGHRDFDVTVDPYIGTLKAAMRRDFTINALMQNVLTGEITDHFGGLEYLDKKVLRHVNDDTFCEDALRVLRAAQFAARFEFSVADETIDLCKKVKLCKLSKERVFEELKKALLKSQKPSLFFETLRTMHKLDEWFPEVQRLIGVLQNPVHHPEGDVWNHTMMVVDAGVRYKEQASDSLGFMLSCLCHDMGKPQCTEEINGVIHSYNHESESVKQAEIFLKRITNEKKLIKYVLNITEHHMKPFRMAEDKSKIKSTNKMFDSVYCPADIIYFSYADNSLKENTDKFRESKDFLEERLISFNDTMAKPYVCGKDLVDAGFTPGISFNEMLEYAHKLRISGVDKSIALKEVISYAKKHFKNND